MVMPFVSLKLYRRANDPTMGDKVVAVACAAVGAFIARNHRADHIVINRATGQSAVRVVRRGHAAGDDGVRSAIRRERFTL